MGVVFVGVQLASKICFFVKGSRQSSGKPNFVEKYVITKVML